VEHDLEREQHDQRAPPQHHADGADPEQDARHGEVPGDVRPDHSTLEPVFSTVRIPSTTPPTAATSSTTEVISKASRWSVRNRRPISAGLPKASEIAGARPSERLFQSSATTTSASSATPATTAEACSQRGPPAQGASARPPR